ncbi:TPA: hypothetical protein RY505_003498 [Escherichia albertii]|nr:hypothetical protein [Escherichia albertii]
MPLEELIALHDANINCYGSLPGMSNTGRAEAIIRTVQARVVYEESTDPFEVSTTYLVATAKLQNYHIGSRQSFVPTHQETPEK